MRLAVISHKEVWIDENSPSGFSTYGGFPQQMEALSELFDSTEITVPVHATTPPNGAKPLIGHNVTVRQLGAPPIKGGLKRRLGLLWLLPLNIPRIWQAINAADCVHTPVPGDIGLIGILLTLRKRKPLFVRYCTLWGQPDTFFGRFSTRLLERVAGGRNVVLATGGSDTPPTPANASVEWIFSTSLTEDALNAIPPKQQWQAGEPLRLITVGRLEPVKNQATLIKAVGLMRETNPTIHLDIVGQGSERANLENLVGRMGLHNAVTFHGNVPHKDVLTKLGDAHIFMLPSHLEGFPKAVLEAMAVGLPVIATSVSVLPQLVGDCGVLLAKPTEDAIVQAVNELASDADRLSELSTIAHEQSRKFSLENWKSTIGKRLESAWQRPLQNE